MAIDPYRPTTSSPYFDTSSFKSPSLLRHASVPCAPYEHGEEAAPR
jgi:hypothetical protein